MSETELEMTESKMSEIFVEAVRLGLTDDRNRFKLRLSPELMVSLDYNTCRLSEIGYHYGMSIVPLIADASVGSYKIESYE